MYLKQAWMALIVLCLTVSASALYIRPCLPVDECTWDKALPLGNSDNDQWGCNYQQYTNWPVNTDEVVTCTFSGGDYASYMLYISIDNDILNCTLNGNMVMPYTQHEGCAPEDPRSGYSAAISPSSGQNTLVCHVRDRGGISHFDACVVGREPIEQLPEFVSAAVPLLVLLLAPGLAFVLVKMRK